MSGKKRHPTTSMVAPTDHDRNLIGRILRRSAGLPEEEDSFVERWDEVHLPNLRLVVSYIVIARHGPAWANPRTVEDALEEIRNDIKHLKKSIALLDGYTRGAINRAGDPGREEYEAANLSGDIDRMVSASNAREAVPREQWTVPAALAALRQLEAAIVPVIERVIKADARMKETGRIPRYVKPNIAYIVARYLYDVTEEIPGLTTSPKVTGPFGLALQEIFDLLSLPKGVGNPGKIARLRLTSELPENSEL